MVGDASRGFYYMMEALNLSEVCNAVGSLGIMRRAYVEALAYVKQRTAFGRRLIEFPMVQETLGKMTAKQEIELETMFEVVELMDKVMGKDSENSASERENILFRLFVALLKVETAEQAIDFAHEAIELHGGNGYTEDFVTPRLLRDAQVLTVWEGTANILGLEVLRLIHKFNVENMFADFIEKRLAGIQQDELAPWKETIHTALQGLLEQIEKGKQIPGDLQTFYCKKIGKKMTDLYESTVALEQLATGDERQKAIAEVYLHELWKKGELTTEPVVLKHFDIITNQTVVPV